MGYRNTCPRMDGPDKRNGRMDGEAAHIGVGQGIDGLAGSLEAFASDPNAGEAALRASRLELAGSFLSLDREGSAEVPAAFAEALRRVRQSGLAFAPTTPEERRFLDLLDLQRPAQLLAAMLLCPAHRLDRRPELAVV